MKLLNLLDGHSCEMIATLDLGWKAVLGLKMLSRAMHELPWYSYTPCSHGIMKEIELACAVDNK